MSAARIAPCVTGATHQASFRSVAAKPVGRAGTVAMAIGARSIGNGGGGCKETAESNRFVGQNARSRARPPKKTSGAAVLRPPRSLVIPQWGVAGGGGGRLREHECLMRRPEVHLGRRALID